MKRIVFLALCLMMLLASAAMAEGMGVQIIGGPEVEAEPVSLDDLKLNLDAEIENWGILTLTGYEVQNGMGYYRSGRNDVWSEKDYNWSGNEAEYIVLYADILNNTISTKDYLASVSVKAVFDDVYEYGGWAFQRNYNNSNSRNADIDADKNKQNTRWKINKADQFAIGPMYEGHYTYGCTLPNAIINSQKPLKLIITIDGNEIIYNIRK